MGKVTVLYRPKGQSVTRIEVSGDPFEVLAWVGCKMFPDADHSPTARLPAWDAYQRRLAIDKKEKRA